MNSPTKMTHILAKKRLYTYFYRLTKLRSLGLTTHTKKTENKSGASLHPKERHSDGIYSKTSLILRLYKFCFNFKIFFL